jgi:hypothetical protein
VWQHIPADVTLKGPMQWMGLMIIWFGMTVKWMGMLVVSERKMKALTVKMETVLLVSKGSLNLAYFVY